MTRTVERGSRESVCTPQRCRRLPRPFLSQRHQQVQVLQKEKQSPQSQAALQSNDETGETKCAAAVEMSAKDVEMKDTECNDEAAADPVRYHTGQRRQEETSCSKD